MSTSPNIPLYVAAANSFSSFLFNFTTGSTIVAAGLGAAMGRIGGKTATYALQSALTDIFWKYIQPHTFEKVFMHTHSNNQAKCVGIMLSYVASVTIPYLFNKYALPLITVIKEETPYLGQLKREEKNHPLTISDAFYISICPAIITCLRALYLTTASFRYTLR